MTDIEQHYVYLDYAATAPLSEEAATAMQPFLTPGVSNLLGGANPNSLHGPGRAAFKALEGARRDVARCLGARRPDEVIFTSGATEADNAALFGLARAEVARRKRLRQAPATPHVITTSIEHEAVLQPAARLEKEGFRVTYLPCDARGFVHPEALFKVLDSDTVLVSIQAANSEIGTIQPLRELVACAHDAGVLFHTDAVQAFGKIPFSVQDLAVDAASFSAHKIGGPKGVGALYLKARTPFEAFLLGGGQENAKRSGTQNVAGAVGFAAAAKASVAQQAEECERLDVLRNKLIDNLAVIPRVSITLDEVARTSDCLCSHVHVLIDGLESETLILRLDQLGFAVSGGSACASHSLEPSSVLRALGIEADRARGALRITLGRFTEESELERFILALQQVIY